MLEKGDDFVPVNLDRPYQSIHPDDLICLMINAKLKRSGGEVRLVVPPRSGRAPSPQSSPSLIKAVARARNWYERVLEGKSSNLKPLTLHAGLTQRYIGRVFGGAFLAPDIVESILEGRRLAI